MEHQQLDPKHRQAIRAAVQRYERPLVGFARRYVRDLDAARQIALDTLLRLCQQPPDQLHQLCNGLDRSRLEGWLFVVARNLAIDTQHRLGPTTTASNDSAGADTPSPAPAATEQGELADIIIHLVDALPPKQAEVLRLRFQQGLSYQGIADLTGYTVSYVGYLIHEGLKSLRARARADQQARSRQSA